MNKVSTVALLVAGLALFASAAAPMKVKLRKLPVNAEMLKMHLTNKSTLISSQPLRSDGSGESVDIINFMDAQVLKNRVSLIYHFCVGL